MIELISSRRFREGPQTADLQWNNGVHNEGESKTKKTTQNITSYETKNEEMNANRITHTATTTDSNF